MWDLAPKYCNTAGLLGLMHLCVALHVGVLGRTERRNTGGVNDRAGRDPDAIAIEIMVRRVEDLAAQIVSFKQRGRKFRMVVSSRTAIRPRSTPAKPRRTGDSHSASSAPESDRLNQCCGE